MKKPIVGNYNWTPQQMARVNAQRQARGQEQLLNKKMEDKGYSDDYDEYLKQVQNKSKPSGIRTSQYDLQKAEQRNIPISERIKASGSGLEEKQSSATDSFRNKREEEQAAFRERFRKKQMPPGGMKGGVSSPKSSSSYARGMA